MNRQKIFKAMKNGGFKIVDNDGWNDYFISKNGDGNITKNIKESRRVWNLACDDAGKILKSMDAIDDDLVYKIQEFESVTIERDKLCYNFRRFNGFTTKVIA